MTISVVLATYNGEKFIREQIDSILAQTLLPDEIIVSDDYSTDRTWEILEAYQSVFPSLFHLYRNTGKHGAHNNFKNAFRYVTSDVVAPCDQDDIWMPEKLERSVAALADGISLVFCQELIRYENGKEKPLLHTMPLLHQCIFGGVIPGHLLVCKREVLSVFDLHTEITFDMGMVLYAAANHSGVGIDYVGCIWRRHKQVVTTEFSDHKTLYVEKISKWKKLFRTLRMLREGEKSDVIARRMHSMHTIIVHYNGGRKEQLIARYMEQQTPMSLIKACFAHMRIVQRQSAFAQASVHTKIGMSLYAFCYPAIYWYDYHIHDSL
jgi:glycosyltransferase involved in cell wall biosynthesis